VKLKAPKNSNYCAIVVQIGVLKELIDCNNVQAAIIMGNQVIVGKDVKIGDIGLYFPVEAQLSAPYLSSNNLYKYEQMNKDITQKGYFEESGRIRCVKFRGNKSEGLFMPHSSISFTGTKPLSVGDEFDELEGIEICKKYIPKNTKTPGAPGSGKNKGFVPEEYESKICDKQFKFHSDTSLLYKNVHRISPEDLLDISYKLHGTSGISSRPACKLPLKWYEKLLKKWLKTKIVDYQYDYIYSSRNKIRNDNPNKVVAPTDYYGRADSVVRSHLDPGMTFYYEIVGPGIQGDFDYGYEPGTLGIYLYRITVTNLFGNIYEFSAKQVRDFCKERGLQAVPLLFYGYASELSDERLSKENWTAKLLQVIKDRYNEKTCYMCRNKLPEEGCVVRVEGMSLQVYKQKSNAFLALETRILDKGISNIEDEN
jgi:hypothetical protein